MNECIDLAEKVRRRIAQVDASIPGSIAEMLRFEVVGEDKGDIVMTCGTMPWMRNSAGTLHGGLCATILDQAMGFVSCCLKEGNDIAPTVQMSISYHRPLHPGEQVIVKVRVISVTHSLMNLAAEASQATCPEKICLSGSGMYFVRQKM